MSATPGHDRAAFAAIGDLVREATGLSFLQDRPAELDAGIRRAMEGRRLRDPERYLVLLRSDPDAFDELLDELVVGETYFFREPQHFEVIRQRVLPPLLLGEAAARPIRVWSAGCATGEEAWSLAILLQQSGVGERARVLGTDISRRALAAAERAVYRPWALRACTDDQRRAFFVPRGADFEVAARYRSLASFRYLNLASDAFPCLANGTLGLDLIVCRNVLIYLDRDTVRRIIQRFHEALVDGGWLVLGSSDPMACGLAPFHDVVTEQGVFYQKPDLAGGRPAPEPWPREVARPRHRVRLSTAPPETVPPPEPSGAEPGGRTGLPDLESARAALARGDYATCLHLAGDHPGHLEASVLRLRATAAVHGSEAALALAADLVARHPLSVEGHFVAAALLAQSGRDAEAEAALRRVLYLDRSVAVAHVLRAALAARRGDHAGARKSWEIVRDLCATLPPDAPLPLGDGERAAALATAAEAQLAVLDRVEGGAA